MPPSRPYVATMVVVAASVLSLYGLLSVFVALVWGPGNSDELVSGGVDLIPWFGLSFGGAIAALGALWGVLVRRPRWARPALLVAAASLAGWPLFLLVGVD
jgi:hypothetical protein